MAQETPDPRTGKFPPVDLNRGVRQQQHRDGYFIAMYEDDPGLYFCEDGSPATDEMAAEAGFDVARFKRERERNRKIAEAKAKIDQEYAREVERIDSEGPAQPSGDESEKPAGEERSDPDEVSVGSWTMRKAARGKWDVLDASGAVVESGITKDEAETMLQMAKESA